MTYWARGCHWTGRTGHRARQMTRERLIGEIYLGKSDRPHPTGEKKEVTEWHNIVLWRGLAEISQKYLHKGDMVYIEGKLRTRSWEKDGVTRYTTEIVADNMNMLSPKTGGGGSGDYSSQERSQNETVRAGATMNDTTDDLPF